MGAAVATLGCGFSGRLLCPDPATSGGIRLAYAPARPVDPAVLVDAVRRRLDSVGARCVTARAEGGQVVVEQTGPDAGLRDLLSVPGILWVGAEAPEADAAPLVAQVAGGLPPGGPVRVSGGRLIASMDPSRGVSREAARAALEAAVAPLAEGPVRPVFQWQAESDAWQVHWLESRGALFGPHVVSAAAVGHGHGPEVLLRFDAAGTRAFAELTRAHVGATLLLVLDRTVELAPRVAYPITGGEVQISLGVDSTKAYAEGLVTDLRTPLPVPLTLESEQVVGPHAR